ncbi:hypothetical protein AMTRI_Chr13g122150 [Amborella trichopoda]
MYCSLFLVFVVNYWCICDLKSRFLKNRLGFSFFRHFFDCRRNMAQFFIKSEGTIFYQIRGFFILIVLFIRYCSLFSGFLVD